MLGQFLTQHETPGRCINHTLHEITLSIDFFNAGFDFRVQGQRFIIQRHFQLSQIRDNHALAFQAIALQGHVIQTQHNIL